MTVKYLLPCSCGEKITIESTQAGQTLRCTCGKDVVVPSMQGVRRLEQLTETADEPEPTSYGGVALGIAFLGLLISLVGGGIAGWTHMRKPTLIDMDYMSPWDTWLIWKSLQEGVRLPQYAESPYQLAMKEYSQHLTVGIVIAVIGILMLACSAIIAFFSRRSQSRHVPK